MSQDNYQDNVNGNSDYDSDDVLKTIKVNNQPNFKIVGFGISCIAVVQVITPDGEEIQVEVPADSSDDNLSEFIGAIQCKLREK